MKTTASNAREALGNELHDYIESTGLMNDEPGLGFDNYTKWYRGDKTFAEYLMPILEHRLALEGKFVPEMYGTDSEYTSSNDSNEQGEP